MEGFHFGNALSLTALFIFKVLQQFEIDSRFFKHQNKVSYYDPFF